MLRIVDIIAFEPILSPLSLTCEQLERDKALEHAKNWRVKTEKLLPVLYSDDAKVRALKEIINDMPSTPDPLTKNEIVALGVVLHQLTMTRNAKVWAQYMEHLNAPVFPFKIAVQMLQTWADSETPNALPEFNIGPMLQRLFDALTVDPLMHEMFCKCTLQDAKWKNVFEFYHEMRLMNAIHKPALRFEHIFLYASGREVTFPAGWDGEITQKFFHLARSC